MFFAQNHNLCTEHPVYDYFKELKKEKKRFGLLLMNQPYDYSLKYLYDTFKELHDTYKKCFKQHL